MFAVIMFPRKRWNLACLVDVEMNTMVVVLYRCMKK